MMTDFQFNFIEGIWWIGLGLSIFPFRFSYSIIRKYRLPLCATLILFGISDFVEMATGAWWQPWWLLVWKTLCIVLGIIFIIFIYKEKNSR
jgi:hypothetical protein